MRRIAIGVLWAGAFSTAFWISRASDASPPEAKAETQVLVQKPNKARGEGRDENVKSTSVLNDPKRRLPPPPHKMARKERSDARHCDINIDNRTPWKIQVFVDGDFESLLGPWGDAKVASVLGATRLYAKAEFLEAPVTSWGPKYIDCKAQAGVTWQITE